VQAEIPRRVKREAGHRLGMLDAVGTDGLRHEPQRLLRYILGGLGVAQPAADVQANPRREAQRQLRPGRGVDRSEQLRTRARAGVAVISSRRVDLFSSYESALPIPGRLT
jgi:hypothetical protein